MANIGLVVNKDFLMEVSNLEELLDSKLDNLVIFMVSNLAPLSKLFQMKPLATLQFKVIIHIFIMILAQN